jgi:hypothetical protein
MWELTLRRLERIDSAFNCRFERKSRRSMSKTFVFLVLRFFTGKVYITGVHETRKGQGRRCGCEKSVEKFGRDFTRNGQRKH